MLRTPPNTSHEMTNGRHAHLYPSPMVAAHPTFCMSRQLMTIACISGWKDQARAVEGGSLQSGHAYISQHKIGQRMIGLLTALTSCRRFPSSRSSSRAQALGRSMACFCCRVGLIIPSILPGPKALPMAPLDDIGAGRFSRLMTLSLEGPEPRKCLQLLFGVG